MINCWYPAMQVNLSGARFCNCHKTKLGSRRLLRAKIRTASMKKHSNFRLDLLLKSISSVPSSGVVVGPLPMILTSCTFHPIHDFGMRLESSSLENTKGLMHAIKSGQTKWSVVRTWLGHLVDGGLSAYYTIITGMSKYRGPR